MLVGEGLCFTTNPPPKTNPLQAKIKSWCPGDTENRREAPMMASSSGIAHPTNVSRITSVSRAAMLSGVPWVLKASFPDMDLFWKKSFKRPTLSEENSKIESQISKASQLCSVYLWVLLKEDAFQKQKEIGLQPKFPVASIALKKQ